MNIISTLQHCKWPLAAVLLFQSGACGEDKAADPSNDIVESWKKAGLDPIELSEPSEDKAGSCVRGKVAKLHVELCTYSDALAADSAKEAGLAKFGSATGAALVRDRYLLLVSDVDRVDVHGKTLNTLAKTFLKP